MILEGVLNHLASLGFVPACYPGGTDPTEACADWAGRLPAAYVGFLSASGGGYFEVEVECELLAPPRHAESGSWRVDNFLDVGEGGAGIASWLETAAGEEVLASGYFPIGEAPGGDLYCVAPEGGAVALWGHETGKFHDAAVSFEDFIRRMRPNPNPPSTSAA